MTKNLYVTPETEVLEVRFEENFCGTGIRALSNQGTETLGYDSADDL